MTQQCLSSCHRDEEPTMVACDKCDVYYHFDCVNLTQELVDKIDHYYCDACEIKFKITTTWYSDKPTREERVMKREHFYEIEKILAHKIPATGERYFKIKWKNYSLRSASWEPESNLSGCLNTLQDYCKKKNIHYSNVRGIIGASSRRTEDINTANWVTIEKIIELFRHYKELLFKSVVLTIKTSTEFGPSDSLHFIDYEYHCFVVLFLAKKKLGIIADGSNVYIENTAYRQELCKILKIRLISCLFNKQNKIDHCGSSAVLIGLELVRAYRDNIRPASVTPPARLRRRVIKSMHPFESKSLKLPALNKREQQLVCPHCNKVYRENKRQPYIMHIRQCSAKAIK